ncbi:MAG: GNAT family N-acetyltransferase, partial [Eubacteriales bacterium]|nr:GNAT family N-acetyltransferase [Eubacteriales bacterium]
KVYLAEGGVDCYLCYFGEEPVGSCDLLVWDGMAKGEDFTICSQWRKQGFGSAVLAQLAAIAREKGAQTFYVMTDEDDTAWQMYRKCGMERVGGRQEWFFTW